MTGFLGVATVSIMLVGGLTGVSPASATAKPVDEPVQTEMETFSIDNSAGRPLLDTLVVLATTPDNSHEVTGLPADVTVNEISGGTDAVVSLQKLGKNYGQLSSAFAVDATGQVLQSHCSLKNGKLHQSF